MADNKKSFILYCDLIHTVEHLTDEQAGHLFKHILEYVNDLNPQTDNVITKLSFEPIKQQLKRDLKKWEEKTGQRSEAGLNSALSKFRTKLDLSTKLEIENIKKDIESRLSNDKENEYLQQALIICNERLTKSTTVESRSTKSTVNVNVNDTVTVNDNDNDNVSVSEINNNKSIFSFSDFWNVYPKKVGKTICENKYNKLTEKDRLIIKNTIDDFVKNKPFKDYVHPNPLTYINQKRWLDNVDEDKKEIPPFEFDFKKYGGDINLFNKLKKEHEQRYN